MSHFRLLFLTLKVGMLPIVGVALIRESADIGKWLHAPSDAVLRFSSEYRPVQLTQHVLAFPAAKNGFLFDRNLNWYTSACRVCVDDMGFN